MKKTILNGMIAVLLISSLSSCATVFGGRITAAQRTIKGFGGRLPLILPQA